MADEIEKLSNEILRLESLISEKKQRLHSLQPGCSNSQVNIHSTPGDKIKLFRSLFKGREDVYAVRFESRISGKSGYQPDCQNEWKKSVCHKPKIKCADCENRQFMPVTDETITNHLTGKKGNKPFVMGLYPMLLNEACYFLAIDFDKKEWKEDVNSFLETCNEYDIPAYLERSRSGQGGHIWIFFSEPIKAYLARKLGTSLISCTLDLRPEIGLDSFDRFFPNQDTLPKGGFGNLIALPLQKDSREKGNSCFIDKNMEPFPDQWFFLSTIKKLSEEKIHDYITNHLPEMPYLSQQQEDGTEASVNSILTNSSQYPKVEQLLPSEIKITLSNQIYVNSKELPPVIRNRILHLAAFSNPEFYKAQAMRLPTWNKPRILFCYEQHYSHIGLPIGCLTGLLDLFTHYGITSQIEDRRTDGIELDVIFKGELYPDQLKAAKALMKKETGVLSATTAFGKTVLALWIIAQRKRNTLILVHRKQLMEQWKERISQFLERYGKIDVAVIQSVNKKGIVESWINEYGQIIVDECHHISAYSFEQVIRQSPAKFKLGLSATVIRKDGQHPIIFMNLGEIRYRFNAKKESLKRTFLHKVISRTTEFHLTENQTEDQTIQDIFRELWQNKARNRLIATDIMKAVNMGREILVLSERTGHLDLLYSLLESSISRLYILKGRMGKKQLTRTMEEINNPKTGQSRVILATGRFLGEGIDLPFLDTLFLTFPVSWKGTVAQYAGRLHRDFHGKQEVQIYDYHDSNVPVLSRMYEKRLKGYRALGYEMNSTI